MPVHTKRYIIFLTSALYGGDLLTSRSGRFISGKEYFHPSNARRDGPQKRSARFGKEKNSFALTGIRNQTDQPITIHLIACYKSISMLFPSGTGL